MKQWQLYILQEFGGLCNMGRHICYQETRTGIQQRGENFFSFSFPTLLQLNYIFIYI